MNIHIITIGDEILIGQIIDTNSAWMGQQLNLAGFKITSIKTISDQLEDIKKTISVSIQEADIVLMTGGLGATKDDVTKKAIADYLGLEMYFDEEMYQKIISFFKRLGRPTNELHRLQCMMPQGVQLLENKMGTAPGMWFDVQGKILISMPGVPYEMKHIMSERVIPRLKEIFGLKPIFHKTLLTAGHGETEIAQEIEAIEQNLPSYIKIAYLPNLGEVRLRISAFGSFKDSLKNLQKEVEHIALQITEKMGSAIYGKEEENLQTVLGQLLLKNNLTLATAESCTGGNIAARIVQISGSSAYFQGGIVAYSNELKMKQLHVKSKTLEQWGAVSEATVKEMVAGAIQNLNVDIAIAVSGIAGPNGGIPNKPVGTIWIAVGNHSKIETRLLQLGKDRLKNIEYTTKQALNFARLFIINNV